MNVIRLVALLGLVAFTASAVTAAEGEKHKRMSPEELDTNKDGALSKEEIAAAPERMRGYLLKSDANMDGALSKDELAKFKEAAEKHRAEREKNGDKPEGKPGDKPEGKPSDKPEEKPAP